MNAYVASPAVGRQPTADGPRSARLREADSPQWKDEVRPPVPPLSESMVPALPRAVPNPLPVGWESGCARSKHSQPSINTHPDQTHAPASAVVGVARIELWPEKPPTWSHLVWRGEPCPLSHRATTGKIVPRASTEEMARAARQRARAPRQRTLMVGRRRQRWHCTYLPHHPSFWTRKECVLGVPSLGIAQCEFIVNKVHNSCENKKSQQCTSSQGHISAGAASVDAPDTLR